jgi:choline dehydrogenase-like flavoprotein
MGKSYDLIVIGSGAGGGTLARHLAPTGKRILLLERGDWLRRETQNWLAEDVFVDGRYVSPDTVNPALTAMASALRVGDHLIERMGARQPQPEPAHVA